MCDALTRHRIESGWPELLPPGIPAVSALNVQTALHVQEVEDSRETGHQAGYEEAETEAKGRERELEGQVEAARLSIRDLEAEISERDACDASVSPGSVTSARLLRAYRTVGLRFAQARNETLTPRRRWSGKTVRDLVARLRDSVTPEFDAMLAEIEAEKSDAA